MMRSPLFPVFPNAAICSLALVLACAPGAEAVTVFSSGFTTDPAPNFTFNSGGGTAGISGTGLTGSSSGRAIELTDTSTSAASSAVLTPTTGNGFPAFDTTLAGQSNLLFTADFAVTTMSVGQSVGTVPRLILQNLSDPGKSIHIGLGRTSSTNAILYAGRGESSDPSDGGTRLLLYNYLGYSTTDASANDTNDLYVTVNISYISGSDTMFVSAYNGATLLGSGNVSGFLNSSFNNSNLAVTVTTGTTAQSTVYLDNVTLQTTVPEPSATALLGSLAALGLLRRTRRRDA